MKDTTILYNTYGDLYDTPQIVYSDNGKPEEISPDTRIDSLEGLLYGDYSKHEELQCSFNLSFYIDKVPHGIVNKQIPGVGATTLEINSNRNSIIVLPTKALAFSKYKKHSNTLYIGSEIKNEIERTTDQEIEEYLQKEGYKKLLVVADSLGRLLKLIKEENYKSYFLMIDEIDVLQSDSNYRPQLEDVIDYYFLFPLKNRCMVTATMKEFTNPLLKSECLFSISWTWERKRNIRHLHTNSIIQTVIDEINSHPNEKIFVAYNSVLQIQNIISSLEEEVSRDCAILCSEASLEEAGKYYVSKLGEGDTLPNRVNFATCCYFTGIDISDNYHLIIVSDSRRDYSMLILDRITQIYGRCRGEYRILSDTIVYNTKDYALVEDMRSYPNSLVTKANKVLKLINAADDISQNDYTLTDLFSIVKEAIKDKAQIKIESNEPINLIRKNIHGKYVPAYLNIDYLVERMELYRGLYFLPEMMKEALSKCANIIEYKSLSYDTNQQQIAIEDENKTMQRKLSDSYIQEAITEIKTLSSMDNLNDVSLRIYARQGKQYKRIFFERFIRLYRYVDLDSLLNQLWEIRIDNNAAFKNLNNAVMYWALAEEHPFKKAVREVFVINQVYSASEIQALLAPIVQYHLHKVLMPRKYITLLKSMYETDRPKNKYIIRGENPLHLKECSNRIAPEDNNLLRYFTF
ncbi:MAG: DEAD/DEAH box helicase [Bacteroides sp.]|nr:DEAD/DEAH box helicase [Bacteroides sp.]